ncbi:MAG: SCO family protein [Flavobacteriaceae bacterium CG_4_8_14_3_um_filter_34_10]|nr:SCO family protein [Flavobacteriia bacterium]PIV48541.1 MAG: SCO family protein [Flavobacteriaceae bacterium CG02_land_8_20_14_3_00_34_13]PIX08846.1 MAG: SCO family protein [Flavobacteriaceae bacterium CG_4_8_14_3_um_filter_34_10]PJC06168.1 MAG: SCO family protein [Flavobacteriaceae bacterium CG_4_9_14_0_8_um_filter_34_30]
MKNYSYIGISFVILVFGIWAVPKIIETLKKPDFAVITKVPDFSFTDQNGKTITNETYIGKVYVLEFFFTTCPSICPIMNQNMLKLQSEFYGNPNFGIASITIDPMHDTSQTLKTYAEEYGIIHPNWHLLTGEKEIIYKLSNDGFKLYSAQDDKAEGGFEHSGLFALIDKEGNVRSRNDEFGNPKIYYNGLDDAEIKMLKEDIKKLL